jgi:hypothetical protein
MLFTIYIFWPHVFQFLILICHFIALVSKNPMIKFVSNFICICTKINAYVGYIITVSLWKK